MIDVGEGGFFGSVVYRILLEYVGEKIILEGYMKIESVVEGFVGFFLCVDGEVGFLYFDNM